MAFSRALRSLEVHPQRREVRGAIAAGHVAPVDHAGDHAVVVDQQVAAVQIAVQPRRLDIDRRADRVLVNANDVVIEQRGLAFETTDPLDDLLGPLSQRHASEGIHGRIRGRRPMQRAQECGETLGLVRSRLAEIGVAAAQPRHDAPARRIVFGRRADAHRGRHRDRQQRRELRQPFLLVLDQLRDGDPSWQTHGEMLAEPEHRVVPARIHRLQWQVRQVGMLRAQERANQRLVDLDVGRRLAVMDDGSDHGADSSARLRRSSFAAASARRRAPGSSGSLPRPASATRRS